MTLSQQALTLDNRVLDLHGERRRIHAAGPFVAVRIPGGPDLVYATARRAVADEVFRHPLLSKDPKHWAALQAGEVPEDWGLLKFLRMKSMLTAEKHDHKRLRAPVAEAFTRARIKALVPHVEQRVAALLDRIPVGELFDLRGSFAYELPMSVICELLGIEDEDTRTRLGEDFDDLHETTSTRAAEAHATIAGILSDLIEVKRHTPGDDLTTALIRARPEGQEPLSHEELVATLQTLVFAGHETTQNLITNETRALLLPRHRGQLELLLSGAVPWANATAEALRFDGSVNDVMFRYAVEEITIAGVTIPKGTPIMLCLAAIGRDPDVFDNPDTFDVTRENSSGHRAFGHGMHFCLGAPLATEMTTIAVRELFTRYKISCPDLDSLTPIPSYASNSVQTLPVIATPRITV